MRSMLEGLELGLNAALAATFGVPVVLVSGDQALAAEARALLGPAVETVVVKEAVGRYAARFALAHMADMAELLPGAVRTGGRIVAYTHADYRETFRG